MRKVKFFCGFVGVTRLAFRMYGYDDNDDNDDNEDGMMTMMMTMKMILILFGQNQQQSDRVALPSRPNLAPAVTFQLLHSRITMIPYIISSHR